MAVTRQGLSPGGDIKAVIGQQCWKITGRSLFLCHPSICSPSGWVLFSNKKIRDSPCTIYAGSPNPKNRIAVGLDFPEFHHGRGINQSDNRETFFIKFGKKGNFVGIEFQSVGGSVGCPFKIRSAFSAKGTKGHQGIRRIRETILP